MGSQLLSANQLPKLIGLQNTSRHVKSTENVLVDGMYCRFSNMVFVLAISIFLAFDVSILSQTTYIEMSLFKAHATKFCSRLADVATYG